MSKRQNFTSRRKHVLNFYYLQNKIINTCYLVDWWISFLGRKKIGSFLVAILHKKKYSFMYFYLFMCSKKNCETGKEIIKISGAKLNFWILEKKKRRNEKNFLSSLLNEIQPLSIVGNRNRGNRMHEHQATGQTVVYTVVFFIRKGCLIASDRFHQYWKLRRLVIDKYIGFDYLCPQGFAMAGAPKIFWTGAACGWLIIGFIPPTGEGAIGYIKG